MKTTFKDEGVLIFFLLVPVFYPLLYSWAYNNEVVREVTVAVVDMSHSSESRKFIHRYDASPDVKVAYKCQDMNEARELVRKQVGSGTVVSSAPLCALTEREAWQGEGAVSGQ